MARYPNAIWKGADPKNYSTTLIHPKFIVCHVMQGSESGADAWFHNPNAIVSAHFGVSRTGLVEQYVDTKFEAYAEMAYNGLAISVEHEGFSGQHLTKQQIEADVKLFTWISNAYHIPLVWRNSPFGRAGVLSHGELGVSGGNHPSCPGEPIIADVKTMLKLMKRRPHFSLSPSHSFQNSVV